MERKAKRGDGKQSVDTRHEKETGGRKAEIEGKGVARKEEEGAKGRKG